MKPRVQQITMFKMKNILKKRCCVSFCKNSSNASSRSQNVTVHEFPTEHHRREEWLSALGMEESHVTDTTAVCSLHFRKVDFYMARSGLRMLQKEAVPSAVQVCLICLNTDTKLYPMSKYHLEAYTNVTGLMMPDDINFAQLLCAKCAHRLTKVNRFRDNCLRAHKLLLDLVTKHEVLTTQNIKTINRRKYESVSNFVTKTFKSDHSNVHAIKHKLDNKNTKLDKNSYNSAQKVKNEIKERLEIVLEPMDIELKCDNESDEEFLNDDIDNDAEFLNNDMNTEMEVSNNDIEDEWNDNYLDLKNSDVELVSDVEVGSDINVSKRVKSVKNKRVATSKVISVINKVRKTSDKSDPKMKVDEEAVPKSFTETTLTYEEQLAEIVERKESSNYKDSKYKCSLCYRGFASLLSYNRHVVKHTKKFGEFECSLCKLRFKTRRYLNDHVRAFHSMNYSCTSCLYVTKQRKTALLHARWHEGTKYKCPQCEEEFSRYSTYMSHLRLKHPSDFVCVLCGYSFVSKMGVQQHCNIKHRFDDKQNLAGPLCEPCNMRFASQEAYNNHMKVSPKHAAEGVRLRNDPMECSYSYRRRRMPKGAEDDNYVTCEQCGVQLNDFRMYTLHFQSVHPDKKRAQYSYQRTRHCLCDLCGKVLKNPTLLRYHMAEHSGLKPFQCDTCSKRFAVKANLAQHVKVHMRSDFECGICGKHFNYKSNRDRHLWIHHEKYFKCEICEKRFSTAGEVRAHVAYVHLKKPRPKKKSGASTKSELGEPGEEIKTSEDEWKPEYDTSVVVEYV